MKRQKCACHGVCESELVGVRKSVCLSVRGIQAEQIRCADPTETRQDREVGGTEKKNRRNEREENVGEMVEKKGREVKAERSREDCREESKEALLQPFPTSFLPFDFN